MDLFDRIYRVHALLRSARHPVSLATIREELADCSRSTATRTIEHMRDHLFAPIDYERGRNGYVLRQTDDGRWELPGLWFNAAELHALLATQALLANMGPGLLEEAVAPMRARIEQLLKSRYAGGRDVARRVRLLRVASRDVEPKHFREVANATLVRKRIRLRYHGRARNAPTNREISPQRLVHYRDNWYCEAWDHAKRALRLFALDRIRVVTALAKAAKDVGDARLDAHIASAYGIFTGRARRTAVLRFTSARARWVADEVWHPRQFARYLPDGTYELRVPYGDERELLMDVLKYGADVEVLAPLSLRRAAEHQLRKALAQYAQKKSERKRQLVARHSTQVSRVTGSRTAPPPPVSFSLFPAGRRDYRS